MLVKGVDSMEHLHPTISLEIVIPTWNNLFLIYQNHTSQLYTGSCVAFCFCCCLESPVLTSEGIRSLVTTVLTKS